ncbi:MAG: RNA 2',3'-cyclic phosphodiesterase [Deltaproteobacteria bacterium]|jgi:2'-5' RNA ligase|nr:RNA 2',3'-cyclic phosphodiesterase [Deltaproteobacteria bacterium]MBW2495812.1 RNA 2',3'-cyclic phosphodiesterase [Deltaproteobacteria bacterium]
MDSMRLFVAIELNEQERQRLHRAAAPLRAAELPVRWVRPDAYHLTLRFLGEVASDRVSELAAVMQRAVAGSACFSLGLGGLGGAPGLRRPRVIWVEIEESEALRRLHQRLEGALADLGFEREPRRFRPHLTLGRLRRDGPAGGLTGLVGLARELDFGGAIEVTGLSLIRSRLASDGARYEALVRAPLAPPGEPRHPSGDAEEPFAD